jgi:5-(carboxyamino)imidazole ribonucleotide mutase
VGVNGAANAGLLAIQMLAIQDADLAAKLSAFKEQMAEGVRAKDAKIQSEVY